MAAMAAMAAMLMCGALAPQTMRASAPQMMDSQLRERMPNTFLSFQPTFAVSDWAAAGRIMEEYVERARSEPGCSYCGWTRSSDLLFISEAHNGPDALLDHLGGVQPYIDKLLAGPATLERVQLHGPEASIGACRSAIDGLSTGLSADCFTSQPGAFSFFSKQTGGMRTGQTICSCKPLLRVTDWEAAQPIMDEYLERTATEPGCIYSGFTRCGDSLLFIREAHSNADAVLIHLANVAPLLRRLCDGPATLAGVEVHAPSMQLARIREAAPLEDLFGGIEAKYFALGGGFQRFEAWSSYVAQPKVRFG